MSNSRYRKLGYSDLEALKIVLVEAIFQGLAEAEDNSERARWAKLALETIDKSKIDWVTDMISAMEVQSPTFNEDAVSVSLKGFDLSKYVVEGAEPAYRAKGRAKKLTGPPGPPPFVPDIPEE